MRGVRDRLRCCFAEALPADVPCRFVRDSNDEDKRIRQKARSREGLRKRHEALIYDLRLSTHKSPITIHKGVYRPSTKGLDISRVLSYRRFLCKFHSRYKIIPCRIRGLCSGLMTNWYGSHSGTSSLKSLKEHAASRHAVSCPGRYLLWPLLLE